MLHWWAVVDRACPLYKELDAKVVRLAAIAHVRHRETRYDSLLARGYNRREARHNVEDAVLSGDAAGRLHLFFKAFENNHFYFRHASLALSEDVPRDIEWRHRDEPAVKLMNSESEAILKRINSVLCGRYEIHHTTIQFECAACGQGQTISQAT